MEGIMQYPPGDSRMIDKIVHQLKSQGIFDQFRKECLADVDTKPAYQNLHQRVEGSVSGFLASQEWRPDLNKNQLRDSLRKHIHESGFLDIGVERIVDQVVNPKIMTVFMPQVEDVVYKFLGIEKPKKGKENQNVYVAPLTIENLAKKEERKLPTLTDLLPKELEPISPESDTLKGKEDISIEDGEVGFCDEKEEEDSSPPFEPIEEINSHMEESSMDSHLSGISELTSHDSQHSHILFNISSNANNSASKPILDLSNNDSQLSKVSSGSRLSIVSLGEQDYKMSHEMETNDESQQSKTSLHVLCHDTQMSGGVESKKKEQETAKIEIAGELSKDSNSVCDKLHIFIHDNTETDIVDKTEEKEIKIEHDRRFDGSLEKKICNESEARNERILYDRFSVTASTDLTDKFQNENDSVGSEKFYIKTEQKDVCDILPHERTVGNRDEFSEIKSENTLDGRNNLKLERKSDETLDNSLNDRTERKVGDKYTVKLEDIFEKKLEDKSETKLNEPFTKRLDDKSDRKLDEKSERKAAEKFEKKSEDKSERKTIEKYERKSDEKFEKKSDEKYERKTDDKSEKKIEKKYEKLSDDKAERKGTEKSEKKQDEKPARKSDDRSARKTDEKSEKKSSEKKCDEKVDKKLDEKTEKKSVEKPEKKVDEKTDRKLEEKCDRKSDSKLEKKDDKHEKKHDRHKEDREKSKDRKRFSSENRDSKKTENSSYSTESERRKSDKLQKERGDSRSKTDKTNKHDSKDAKNRLKYDEKMEKDATKEKLRPEMKDSKDERRTEEKDKKAEKESSKERIKKEEAEISKYDKETKKLKNDDKKEKDIREKQKSDDRGRSKHDEKHRDRTKSEGKDKSDKEKCRHDEKTKDSSRSNSKDSKERSKQDEREKGKETPKYDERKCKEKLKHDEKSIKALEKGAVKKSDNKPSRSTDHKSKDSGKKGKDSKGKSVTDDHRIHREKHSEDRRSADRDSNGTTQDRSLGSTASRPNGNESQPSQSRHEKSGGTSTSSKSDSGGNSDSSCMNNQCAESSMNTKEPPLSPSKSSPPSSLPFKKRPLSLHSEDETDGEGNGESPKPSRSKIKKPKIAANIFEVKKIMMLRKSLAKKERKQQKELQKVKDVREGSEDKARKKIAKPVLAKRKKLGNVEKSLRKEVLTSLSHKQTPKVESEKEDIPEFKYFESELIPSALSQADSHFLAYVKRLVENDSLSDISTPSDTGSEVSEVDAVISLSDIDFDEVVAKELGATFIETSEGTQVLFDESPERNKLSKRRTSIESEFGTMVDFNIIGDTVVRINVDSRPDSGMSNWSDKSDDILYGGSLKRRRQHSSSSNSNKSGPDKIEQTYVAQSEGKNLDISPKPRKRVFSRKRPKKDIEPNPEINSKPAVERRELRRTRKPSTRYSSKEFANYTDDDTSCDGFPSELIKVNSVEEHSHLELKSDLVVVLHDVSKSNLGENRSPISSSTNKFKSSRTKIPATITHDVDSSDQELVSERVGDGYDIIRENNNVDKGSSEDERGCGDGSMLNQDLILPTLRDLMVESGFRREDDKSDFLPSLVDVGNCVSNENNVESSEKQNLNDSYASCERTEGRRTKLGRSRRVGLSRPPPKYVPDQANNEIGVNRTATPPDFVMPLSPESDVSASSGEAKKALHDKVGDNNTEPSASNSEDKTVHVSNSRNGDPEIRRSLRSGGIGTPGGRGQRYNSDDLYKPRPLFSQGSRRVRGRVSPTMNEDISNCTDKLTSDFSETPLTTAKKRR